MRENKSFLTDVLASWPPSSNPALFSCQKSPFTITSSPKPPKHQTTPIPLINKPSPIFAATQWHPSSQETCQYTNGAQRPTFRGLQPRFTWLIRCIDGNNGARIEMEFSAGALVSSNRVPGNDAPLWNYDGKAGNFLYERGPVRAIIAEDVLEDPRRDGIIAIDKFLLGQVGRSRGKFFSAVSAEIRGFVTKLLNTPFLTLLLPPAWCWAV